MGGLGGFMLLSGIIAYLLSKSNISFFKIIRIGIIVMIFVAITFWIIAYTETLEKSFWFFLTPLIV